MTCPRSAPRGQQLGLERGLARSQLPVCTAGFSCFEISPPGFLMAKPARMIFGGLCRCHAATRRPGIAASSTRCRPLIQAPTLQLRAHADASMTRGRGWGEAGHTGRHERNTLGLDRAQPGTHLEAVERKASDKEPLYHPHDRPSFLPSVA